MQLRLEQRVRADRQWEVRRLRFLLRVEIALAGVAVLHGGSLLRVLRLEIA